MNKKRILQLASFSGNIGDIINHEGFYNKLNQLIDVQIDRIEMRKFYRNSLEMKFDSSLADKINSYDALIIGGGWLL